MSEFRFSEKELKKVSYFRAPEDNRIVAIYVRGDFDEYEKFPPYLDTEEEIAHLKEAYRGADHHAGARTRRYDSSPLPHPRSGAT